MHRLTYKKPDGRFGVKGMDWSDIPRVFYGLICKLKDYEDTGLSPEEVERLKDENERLKKGEKTRENSTKDTIEMREVKIAVKIMQAAGICRYESAERCRRFYVDEKTCDRCIESWLLSKARSELKKEDKNP